MESNNFTTKFLFSIFNMVDIFFSIFILFFILINYKITLAPIGICVYCYIRYLILKAIYLLQQAYILL